MIDRVPSRRKQMKSFYWKETTRRVIRDLRKTYPVNISERCFRKEDIAHLTSPARSL